MPTCTVIFIFCPGSPNSTAPEYDQKKIIRYPLPDGNGKGESNSMFAALRRMIVPIIGIVLFFFVALIVLEWGFDFSGRGAMQQGGSPVAGLINGEEIPWDLYNASRENAIRNSTQNSTEELTDGRRRELERQAWSQLVMNTLLRQEAKKLNITVTGDDIYTFLKFSPPQFVQTIPEFQTNGQFDYQKYLGMMADPNAAPFWAQMEEIVRDEILVQKVQMVVIDNVVVSEADIRQAFLDSLETASVAAVLVPYSRFAGQYVAPSDADARAFYDKNKARYEMEERASLNLIMIEDSPSESDWMRVRGRATQLYDSIRTGADFGQVAEAFSDDPGSAVNGGSLGWFEPGRMVREFDSAAFAMKEGEMSQPIRTMFGWHILKHFGYRELPDTTAGKGVFKKEAQVAHILLKVDLSDVSREETREKLEEFATRAAEEGWQQAASALNLQPKTTAIFFRNDAIQYIGDDAAASAFAFTQPVNSISPVMSNDLGTFVLQVASHNPKGVATFDEVKGRVGQDWFREQTAGKARDTAQAIYADFQTSRDLAAAARRHGAELKELPAFSRTSFVSGVGRDPRFAGAAFALTMPGQTSEAFDYAAGSAIVQLLNRTSPDLTTFNEKRDELSRTVRFARQQEMYGRWYDRLLKSSTIVDNTQGTALLN